MAKIFGVEVDPTPGFNLGVTDAWNRTTRAGNSFQGSGGNQVNFSNPTGQGVPAATQAAKANQNKDPGTKNDSNPTDTPVVLGANTLSGGGGSSRDAELARLQIEQGLSQYNNALGRLDGQLDVGLGNIGRDYDSAYGRLTGQRDMARRDNETSVNNQLQEYETSRNTNNQNARNLLMGTRRLLGGAGAGGGSADLFGAPLAATTEANNANAQVRQTNERNLAALSTARDDNERQFENSFADLDVQRRNSENSYRRDIETQRADILNNIAQLTGQQRIAQGGGYQQALAASQPYTDRVRGILDSINGLTSRVGPIQERAVNLARPDLAQYNLARYDAPAVARQDPSMYTPAYRALINPDEEQLL